MGCQRPWCHMGVPGSYKFLVSNNIYLRWLVDICIYAYICWFFLRVCLCAHAYSWAMFAHRHTGRIIIVHCIYHNHVCTVFRFSLVVWLFVSTIFMSIFILFINSIIIWIPVRWPLQKLILWQCLPFINTWMHNSNTFLCTKILNRRPQILTVPVLPGIFHYFPCSYPEI